MHAQRLARYSAELLIDALNKRYDARLALEGDSGGGAFVASDGAHRAGVFVAKLWDDDAAWNERPSFLAQQLDAVPGIDGAFMLWVPPRASLPRDAEAPAFVQRVLDAARSLAPGDRTEVTFPVTVKLAKSSSEGGYASVSGGLNRWWTRITETVNGTVNVDSTAVHRITRDGAAREDLWLTFGQIAAGIDVGQLAEFEIDEAWTLQRLATNTRGFAIAGAPPPVDQTDGVLLRRMARKRLQQANESLAQLDVAVHAVGLLASYEYAELEGAGATIRGLDPGLYSRLEVVAVIADGDVRPTFLPRALPWQ
jgi:hypothetical protein